MIEDSEGRRLFLNKEGKTYVLEFLPIAKLFRTGIERPLDMKVYIPELDLNGEYSYNYRDDSPTQKFYISIIEEDGKIILVRRDNVPKDEEQPFFVIDDGGKLTLRMEIDLTDLVNNLRKK